jgi:hypothetical protein
MYPINTLCGLDAALWPKEKQQASDITLFFVDHLFLTSEPDDRFSQACHKYYVIHKNMAPNFIFQ